MNYSLVYITCAHLDEAEAIAARLLKKKLVACANIMPPHKALYRWEGKLESSHEVAVILKTRSALFSRIEQEICHHHSYSCPCIIEIPIATGHNPFMQWINKETQSTDIEQ